MRIAVTPLDSEQLTAIEIDLGDGAPWVFLPFEDREAQVDPLDARYVLARGRRNGVAIFDCVERRRTNLALDASLKNHIWTFAEGRGSVFIVESLGDKGYGHLRELSLDGAVNRSWPIAEGFHAAHLHMRDDGAVVCTDEWSGKAAIFDPSTGTSETGAITGWRFVFKYNSCQLGWYSPDGRWALRAHLGSVIRRRPDKPSLLARWLGQPEPARHPDLRADGQAHYGVGLDLVRLDSPVRIEKTLVVRYLPAEKLFPSLRFARLDKLHPLQRDALARERQTLAAFDALADHHDFDGWNGVDQLFMARFSSTDSDGPTNEAMDELVHERMFRRIKNVAWDADSRGFTVVFDLEEGLEERHVSLDGDVAPLRPSDWVAPSSHRPWGDAKLVEALRKDLRARAIQRVAMADLSPCGLLGAVRDLADRMEAGLEAMVFRDTLQLQFKVARNTVSEPAFFAKLDALAPEDFAPVLPHLRRLLSSFSDQAARHVCTAHATIIGGGEPEGWKLALSDAALVLARRDPASQEILTDWFKRVDQEHDSFAAEQVFPAIVKTTGWATSSATRFGLWFALQQWQTVTYDLGALGIIDAAQRHWTPEAFAELALDVAEELVAETGPASVGMALGSCLGRIEEMLEPVDAWRARALVETSRLFQVEPIRPVYIM